VPHVVSQIAVIKNANKIKQAKIDETFKTIIEIYPSLSTMSNSTLSCGTNGDPS